MDAHLTLNEHLNRCMKKARAAAACLLSLKKPYTVVPARRESRPGSMFHNIASRLVQGIHIEEAAWLPKPLAHHYAE